MKSTVKHTILPITSALIWGVAFVFQKNITAGAFTFNALRSIVGFLFLLVVIPFFNKGDVVHILCEKDKKSTKMLWLGGFCCGLALTLAAYLQQVGLNAGTEAGKASFLTALYIVIVPIVSMFFKKKAPYYVWISVAIAVLGLYLLCIKDGFSVNVADIYVLSCAFVFTAHILVIDYFSQFCDGVKMSCVQFLTVSVLSLIFAFIFENPTWTDVTDNLFNVLYLGIFSSGIAYTLQIVAQKGANPTVLTILLSLESVFGTLAGAIILHEVLLAQEYIGCFLMFSAVIIAQLPQKSKN